MSGCDVQLVSILFTRESILHALFILFSIIFVSRTCHTTVSIVLLSDNCVASYPVKKTGYEARYLCQTICGKG